MVIAVYGANGYQGKLVLTELSRRGADVVLVGRDPTRLRVAAVAAGVPDAPRRVASLDDHGTLVAAFAGSAVVINCAGPFTGTGESVVRAAIAAGCHYVDTAGEQLYVKSVFDTYADAAASAGVTVVPATNDGCLPVDLVAHLLAERVPALAEIAVSHVLAGGGGMSRGSLRSLLSTLDVFTAGFTYSDGDWRTGVPARHTSIVLPGERKPTAVVKLGACEVVTIPRHVPARHVESLVDATLADRIGGPIPVAAVANLPEGPTPDERAAQLFTYVVDATDTSGTVTRAVVRGTDTYGTTAVIAVEAAHRLGAGAAKPGVLAPAQAFDPVGFLDVLTRRGLNWTLA